MKKLINLLAGCIISVSSSFNSFCYSQCDGKEPEQVQKQTQVTEQSKQSVKYNLLNDYINDFCKDYLNKAKDKIDSIQNSIRKHGLEAVLANYIEINSSSLDLAFRIKEGKMKEKEIRKEYEKIAEKYLTNVKKVSVNAPIDYSNKEVLKAHISWVAKKTDLYKRLLSSNLEIEKGKITSYKALIKRTMTREEFTKLILEQTKVIDEVYDSFVKSRTGFSGLFAKPFINDARKFAKEYYLKSIDDIYGKEEKEIKKE